MNSPLEKEKLFESLISETSQPPSSFAEDSPHFLISSTNTPCLEKDILQKIDNANLSTELHQRARQELLGLGPLEAILSNPGLSEILIHGAHNIWVEVNGHFQPLKDHFWHETSFKKIIHHILQESLLRFDKQNPCTQGTWREFRLQLTSPPITQDITLSLRRQRTLDWSLQDFVQQGWCSEKNRNFLLTLIEQKKNLLVFGETGSGKTSCCNALLQEVKNNERVLLLQENDELILPNSFSLKLFTQTQKDIAVGFFDLQELVKLSLRLRPQRIVVGEIRGAEAKDYLLALSTGHSGGLTTIHAKSAREALWRLQLLIQMGAPQWGTNVITGLIQQGIDYVIGVTQKEGQRRLSSIVKVCGYEGEQFLLESAL